MEIETTDIFVGEIPQSGICEVDIPELKKVWDFNFSISVSFGIYTLMRFNPKSTNFTKTELKATISKEQARQIVNELSLQFIKCTTVTNINAGTYRWHGSLLVGEVTPGTFIEEGK